MVDGHRNVKLLFIYVLANLYDTPIPLFSSYWSRIDTAIRTMAYKGVHVRLMGSCWNNTSPDMDKFLSSLSTISGTNKGKALLETVSLFWSSQKKPLFPPHLHQHTHPPHLHQHTSSLSTPTHPPSSSTPTHPPPHLHQHTSSLSTPTHPPSPSTPTHPPSLYTNTPHTPLSSLVPPRPLAEVLRGTPASRSQYSVCPCEPQQVHGH